MVVMVMENRRSGLAMHYGYATAELTDHSPYLNLHKHDLSNVMQMSLSSTTLQAHETQ